MEVNDLESFSLSASMQAAEGDSKTPPLMPLSPQPAAASSSRPTSELIDDWNLDITSTPLIAAAAAEPAASVSLAFDVAPLISLGAAGEARAGEGAGAGAEAVSSDPTIDHLSALQMVQPLADRDQLVFQDNLVHSLDMSSSEQGGLNSSTSLSPPDQHISHTPPSLSSSLPFADLPRNNDPGYPGNLTEEQREACRSLLSFMETELESEVGREQGNILLIRMGGKEEVACKLLRANNWKVDKAKLMLSEILEYRSSNHLHDLIHNVIGSQLVLDPSDPAWRPTILDPGVRKVLGFVPCRRIGFTQTGQLVEYWAIANLFPADLQKHCIHDEILRWWHFHLESGLLGALVGARHYGSVLRGSVVIFDLLGLSSRHMNTHVLRLLHQLFEIGQKKYPESLSKVFVLNSPSLFYGIWRIIKPVLNERTRNKIVICSKGMHDDLLAMLPEQVLEHMEACKKDKMQDMGDSPPPLLPPPRSGNEAGVKEPTSCTGGVTASKGDRELDLSSTQSLPVDLQGGGAQAMAEGQTRSSNSCTEVEGWCSAAPPPAMLLASSPSQRGSDLLLALTSHVSPIMAEEAASAHKLPADQNGSFRRRGEEIGANVFASPLVQPEFDSSSIAKMFQELDLSSSQQ
eukprot:749267-Hanusia_phi.AAC.1